MYAFIVLPPVARYLPLGEYPIPLRTSFVKNELPAMGPSIGEDVAVEVPVICNLFAVTVLL